METPEETVRQEYLCVLVNEYGFNLDQMDEELEVTGRGSGHARADFVIWRTVKDKADNKKPAHHRRVQVGQRHNQARTITAKATTTLG